MHGKRQAGYEPTVPYYTSRWAVRRHAVFCRVLDCSFLPSSLSYLPFRVFEKTLSLRLGGAKDSVSTRQATRSKPDPDMTCEMVSFHRNAQISSSVLLFQSRSPTGNPTLDDSSSNTGEPKHGRTPPREIRRLASRPVRKRSRQRAYEPPIDEPDAGR